MHHVVVAIVAAIGRYPGKYRCEGCSWRGTLREGIAHAVAHQFTVID